MKKRIIRIAALVIAVITFAVSTVGLVSAISTADAKEPIDTSRSCSLTLTYSYNETYYEGLEIEIYRIADVTEDLQYSLTDDFEDYSVEINKISSSSEWDEVCSTIGMYVDTGKVERTNVLLTDENGKVSFRDLKPGIYYVKWTNNPTKDNTIGFLPFLIAVPGIGEDGKWIYDVDAIPKPGYNPYIYYDKYTVVKQWRDIGLKEKRPVNVSVQIYRDGELFDEVILSEENNWTYTWATHAPYKWNVIEKNLPSEYKVIIVEENGVFYVTNSIEDPAPQTGDTNDFSVWIVLMAISGLVLVILGTTGRRKYAEND